MGAFVRRRAVTIFWITAFVIGAIVQTIRASEPGLLVDGLHWVKAEHRHGDLIDLVAFTRMRPLAITLLLFPFAPTIAAAIIIGLGWGRGGYMAWLDRLRPWRQGIGWRQGLGTYFVFYLLYLGVCAFAVVLVALHGAPGALDDLMLRYGGGPYAMLGLLIVAPFLSSGPMLEEMGWRGFALPALLGRCRTPLHAAIILGALWYLWHQPREVQQFMAGQKLTWDYAAHHLFSLTGFIGHTIIIVFFFNKTGGSVWTGVLGHALHNEVAAGLFIFAGSGVAGDDTLYRWVEIAAGVVTVLLAGKNLGIAAPLPVRPQQPASDFPPTLGPRPA